MMPLNRDKIVGLNFPRQTYAFSGADFVQDGFDGRRPPIIVSANPPGLYLDNFTNTYGGSLDSYLSIIDGADIKANIDSIAIPDASVYFNGLSHAENNNLWTLIELEENINDPANYSQQIAFMVHGTGDTIGAHHPGVESVRGIGIRLPMMAAGWGRTTELLAIVEDSDDPRKIDDSVKLDRTQWKSGPVDLRWNPNTNSWTAFNDLIVDHKQMNLGTPVFSTNDDDNEGFPFIRGKLEDAWWVRKPYETKDVDGRSDNDKSGEVMTHLRHRWFDISEEGAARLDSIFIIPHNSITRPGGRWPHTQGNQYGVGGEITASSQSIDIKTVAHFWEEEEKDGPIKFGRKLSELGNSACCYNPNSKYFFGEMIFMDEDQVGCGTGPEGAVFVAPGGGNPEFKWVPSIQVDECELMGEHMVNMVTNDLKLSHRMADICNQIGAWSLQLKANLEGNFNEVTGAIGCLNAELQGLAAAASKNDSLTFNILLSIIEYLVAAINNGFDAIAQSVQEALASCDCEVFISSFNIDMSTGGAAPGAISVDACPVQTNDVDEFDCKHCWGPDIKGPCTDQTSYTGGQPCKFNFLPPITTSFGTCSAHDGV